MGDASDDLGTLKDDAARAAARGDARLALELYERIAELEPDEGRWVMKRAECRRALGDVDAAAALYRAAAAVFARGGAMLDAIAACRVAYTLRPDDPETRKLLATLSGGDEHGGYDDGALADDPDDDDDDDGASERGEDRPSIEPFEFASKLPTHVPPDAEAGVVEVELEFGEAADDESYEELTLDVSDLAAMTRVPAAPRAPSAPPPPPSPTTTARTPTPAMGTRAPGGAQTTLGPTLARGSSPPTTRRSSGALPAVTQAPAKRPGSAPLSRPTPAGGLELDDLPPIAPREPRRLRQSDPLDAGDELFGAPRLATAPRPAVDPARLGSIPLLGSLPPEVLATFVRRVDYMAVSPGTRVLREGDPAEAVYLVVRGDLVVARGDPPRPLARLSDGAFFGEMALLDDAPRSASVVAVTDVELLSLPRELVVEICDRYPTVLATLMSALRSRMVQTLSATSPLFAPIAPSERPAVVERFRLRAIAPGTTMIREGKRTDGLYVIVTGKADVTAAGKSVATLGTGAVAGEMSLLFGGEAQATVTAKTSVTALVLPRADFQQLVMVHPQILDHLASLSESRMNELERARGAAAYRARNVRRV